MKKCLRTYALTYAFRMDRNIQKNHPLHHKIHGSKENRKTLQRTIRYGTVQHCMFVFFRFFYFFTESESKKMMLGMSNKHISLWLVVVCYIQMGRCFQSPIPQVRNYVATTTEYHHYSLVPKPKVILFQSSSSSSSSAVGDEFQSNNDAISARTNSHNTQKDGKQKKIDGNNPMMTLRVNGDNTSTNCNVVPTPFWKVLWRFTRPHTIIGSAMAIPALHIFAAPTLQAAVQPAVLRSMVFAMFPSLLMNLYITGLNQITDVDIDKVNKPYLPIASGDLSPKVASIIVGISLVVSLLWGISHATLGTHGLNVALWGSMILGTLYSLPPFRLKRFPFLAAFCIVAVRGAIINAGFFAHAQVAAFGTSTTVWNCLLSNSKCFLSSLFFAIFGVVIALMKDVPDYTGDALFNIRSFTVRAGPNIIFHSMRKLLTTAFVGVGAFFLRGAIQAPNPTIMISRILVCISSIAAGLSVRDKSIDVNPENSTEVYGYYMHLWKLFYLSYLVLPFVR